MLAPINAADDFDQSARRMLNGLTHAKWRNPKYPLRDLLDPFLNHDRNYRKLAIWSITIPVVDLKLSSRKRLGYRRLQMKHKFAKCASHPTS
jgi:hypothetical protein